MGKLQYDSFYKFIVSTGTVLVAAPIIGIYFLLTGSYDAMISQEQYDKLSKVSLQLFIKNDTLMNIVFKFLPWILLTSFLIGSFCIIWGGFKWYKIQKTLDENIQLDVNEKRFKYKKLTASEVAEKAVKASIEIQDVAETSNLSTQSKRIIKGLQIQNACYTYLNKKFAKAYKVQQNLRVGQNEFDILAFSNKDDLDLIYEIKSWNNIVTKSTILMVVRHMESSCIEYRNITNRNFKSVLLIVSNSKNISEVRNSINRYISDTPEHFSNINIEFMDEKELNII